MKKTLVTFVREMLNDQHGQILPWIAVVMVGLLGTAGLSMDLGRAYIVRGQLQNFANAAALAAAGEVYNTSSSDNATTVATLYSAGSGDKNSNTILGTITPTVTTKCLNLLMPTGSSCGSSSPSNAVQVKESAAIPTYFMRLFGYQNLNVSATATASMQGESQPWNVAIIMDATGSMSTTDSNCGSITEFQCAMNGVKTLLQETNPCATGTSCSSSSALFRVALFGFPEVSTATVADENNCSGGHSSTPAFLIYALPPNNPIPSSYSSITYKNSSSQSFTATYEVTEGASDADANGFVSDYYLPSASNGLNTSSSLVKAVSGCMQPISQAGSGTGGLQGASSGGITYYAGVLYAAQAALTAEANANPGTKNAIIFLSDGQANLVSSTPDLPTAFTANPSSSGLNTVTTTGSYPSYKDECQQAIVAAQAAATAGTRLYGVAYGSEQSGCSSGSGATDTQVVATGQNAAFTSISQLTPCVTIENIASSLDYFYSDYKQSGTGTDTSCVDDSHTVTSLQEIFASIAATFSKPRLVPNSAT